MGENLVFNLVLLFILHKYEREEDTSKRCHRLLINLKYIQQVSSSWKNPLILSSFEGIIPQIIIE